jgi:hypothetical protein
MSSVLKRKLFMQPPVKKAAGGIMALIGEEGDDEVQDNFADRVPENPEIIANNLRGDIRSLEERYFELAQMVGEQAFETPEDVLVLMQAQMGQMPQPGQQAAPPAPSPQGLAALAQGAPEQQQQPGAPAQQPAPGGQQPGGIESLVAEPAQQPTQQQQPAPPTQAPVQRAMGSGPMGEMSAGMPMDMPSQAAIPETMSPPPPMDMEDALAEDFVQATGGEDLLLKVATGEITEDLAERMLMPVRRQLGSPIGGERIEPTMRISDFINQGPTSINQQAANSTRAPRIPAWQRSLMSEGILPDTPDNTPKSRPLTPEELAERVRVRENEGPLKRRIYDFARAKGIDPNVAESRVKNFLRRPGVRAFTNMGSKVAGMASRVPGPVGVVSAVGALGLGTLDYLANEQDKNVVSPNEGVVPSVGSLADMIPPLAGTPMGPSTPVPPVPPSGADAVRAAENANLPSPGPGEPITLRALTEERGPKSEVAEVVNDYTLTPDYTNAMDAGQGAAFAPEAPKKEEGESTSDFAKRVRERAGVYKELLGDDPAMRKAQAYFILAEAGLQLAGNKGKTFGERLQSGLAGVPSAFAQLVSEKTKADKAITASAISAVEQEDRDTAKYAASYANKVLELQRANMGRDLKIRSIAEVIQSTNPGMTPQSAVRMATFQVDGAITNDALGNMRDPTGRIIAYGPANQPTIEGQLGFIPDNHPLIRIEPSSLPAAQTVEEMTKIRDDRAGKAKLLAGVQSLKPRLEEVYGPMNVIRRGLTAVIQPILGDLGPLDSSNQAHATAVRMFQKDLKELIAMNPERVSVYEQQKIDALLDNPNSFFRSDGMALANLLEFERSLINSINQADHRLNPSVPLKQISRFPVGTKADPLPGNAVSLLPEYFNARPTGTVYIQRPDGKVMGITKQQYEAGLKTQ